MTFNELGEKFAGKLADNAILTRENRQLRAEHTRLREALRGIENTPPANIQRLVATPESWWKRLVVDMRDQARAALQDNGSERYHNARADAVMGADES
jgi:hypothetical protein